MLIVEGYRSGKINVMLNLTNHQPYIDKIYLYVKYSYEAKYYILTNTPEKVGLKHYNDPEAFIEYCSNYMQDVYKNIEKYNPIESR